MNATPPSSADRRTLTGLFVRPGKQIRYAFIFLGGSFFLLTLVIGLEIPSLSAQIRELQTMYSLDPKVAAELKSALTSSLTIACTFSAVLTVFAFFIGLILSHRIYGPLVPISRHLQNLIDGNYASRVKLRKADDLQELQPLLNALAEKLQAQQRS